MDLARKTKKRLVIIGTIVVLLLLLGFTNFGRYIILRQYDAVRLATFSRRIADADRAVAKSLGGSVELTFTGDQLKTIIRAVSSAKSARMPDGVFMSSAFATVTFHRGTNILGEINMSDELFALPGGPMFFDSSAALSPTIYTPLRQKMHEAYAADVK